MSDEESVDVDVSTASTSASTPHQAVPTPPDAAKLQEMLQLRAKQAIEGAKARGVVRDNQRLADGYTYRLLKKIIYKLGWVEEERSYRERTRKARNASSTQPERLNNRERRRERKRERRQNPQQQPSDFEEVPGGGQFIMMLLSKNQQVQQSASQHGEDGGQTSTPSRDPAILQDFQSPPGLGRRAAAPGKGAGREQASDLPERRRHASNGIAGELPTKPDAPRKARLHGGTGAEQLSLQSLLGGVGIESGDEGQHKQAKQAPGPTGHLCKASERIQSKLLKSCEDAKVADPVLSTPLTRKDAIPPTIGFSNSIWGPPGAAVPSSSPFVPASSPWASGPADPWAVKPPADPLPMTPSKPSAAPPASPEPLRSPPLSLETALEHSPPSRGKRGLRIRVAGPWEPDRHRPNPQDHDPWDMPVPPKFPGAPPMSELPEFFRDSAAPAFWDQELEGPRKLELDREIQPRTFKPGVREGRGGRFRDEPVIKKPTGPIQFQ